MKLTATVVLSFSARSLREAGEQLDAFLEPARERDDIEVKSVDLQTPSAGAPVTIPYTTAPHTAQPSLGDPRPARPVQ